MYMIQIKCLTFDQRIWNRVIFRANEVQLMLKIYSIWKEILFGNRRRDFQEVVIEVRYRIQIVFDEQFIYRLKRVFL